MEREEGILLRPVGRRPSMLKIDGLWVHHGSASANADYAQALDTVRDERLDAVLKI
jgi:hypothetical protein